MSSYQTFTVLSNFCRLINLLMPYQSFVDLSNFCSLLFTLSTNHINMCPLHTSRTTLAPLSKYLLLTFSYKTTCIITVPGLFICLTVETSVGSFEHRRILYWRALHWLTTPNLLFPPKSTRPLSNSLPHGRQTGSPGSTASRLSSTVVESHRN